MKSSLLCILYRIQYRNGSIKLSSQSCQWMRNVDMGTLEIDERQKKFFSNKATPLHHSNKMYRKIQRWFCGLMEWTMSFMCAYREFWALGKLFPTSSKFLHKFGCFIMFNHFVANISNVILFWRRIWLKRIFSYCTTNITKHLLERFNYFFLSFKFESKLYYFN